MLLFNYFLASLIKPGYLDDIENSKFYKKNNPYYFLDFIEKYNFISFNNILKENEMKLKEKITFIEKLLIGKKKGISLNNIFSNNNNNTTSFVDDKVSNVDYSNSEDEKQSQNYIIKDETINDSYSNEPDDSINHNEKLINDYLYAIEFPHCKICEKTKPSRTHHCNICNKCVLKMDHHCPWMNNCIGLYNHKYFLLFLFYLLLYCSFYSILIAPIFFSDNRIITKELNFISILCLATMIISLFFNAWNWFISFKGLTAIEFWGLNLGLDKIRLKNFSFDNWKQNIFYIFGTYNFIKIFLIPNIKRIPFSGLEICRKINTNFKIEGIEETNIYDNNNNNVINKILFNRDDEKLLKNDIVKNNYIVNDV